MRNVFITCLKWQRRHKWQPQNRHTHNIIWLNRNDKTAPNIILSTLWPIHFTINISCYDGAAVMEQACCGIKLIINLSKRCCSCLFCILPMWKEKENTHTKKTHMRNVGINLSNLKALIYSISHASLHIVLLVSN